MDEPPGAEMGLCLKTLCSNLLQDADISKSQPGGQVGSRLPFNRCEIKTAWPGRGGAMGGRERDRKGVGGGVRGVSRVSL